MADSTELVVFFVTVILLLACTCASAYGEGEVLPWGVERIRAYCLWDNNMDMTVDEGANAGQNVTIAVIDSGIDYYINASDQIVYHPDLAGKRGLWNWFLAPVADVQCL